jgi:hypothetical protein
MTVHPDVSGRPHVLLMHERYVSRGINVLRLTDSRIIEHINSHEGVEWWTMGEICSDFKSKNPPAQGAKLPASREEILKKFT